MHLAWERLLLCLHHPAMNRRWNDSSQQRQLLQSEMRWEWEWCHFVSPREIHKGKMNCSCWETPLCQPCAATEPGSTAHRCYDAVIFLQILYLKKQRCALAALSSPARTEGQGGSDGKWSRFKRVIWSHERCPISRSMLTVRSGMVLFTSLERPSLCFYFRFEVWIFFF